MCSGALRNHATKDPPYGNGADLTAGGIARDITRLAKSNETTPQKPGTDRGGGAALSQPLAEGRES